ncbi:FAR-17a/AIG1-like protein [Peziza echinospora]|nr:FAR-17a/AIG1-like protein [Peziza echinospora]
MKPPTGDPKMSRRTEKHPLQRYNSPSRYLSASLHLAGLSSFAYSFYFLYLNPNELSQGFGWHLKLLTYGILSIPRIIGLALSAVTLLLAFLADVTVSNRLFKLKNVFSTITTPLEVVITILYWGIGLISPAAVVPTHLKRPLFEDLGMHLFPAVFLALDMLLLSPPWTMTLLEAGGIGGLVAGSYWVWTEECYRQNGWYPYPLFEMLDHQQRAMVFAGSAVIFAISALGLKSLYGVLNGVVKAEVKRKL